MAAIVGAIATVIALIVLFLRRIFRAGEPGTAEEEEADEQGRAG